MNKIIFKGIILKEHHFSQRDLTQLITQLPSLFIIRCRI